MQNITNTRATIISAVNIPPVTANNSNIIRRWRRFRQQLQGTGSRARGWYSGICRNRRSTVTVNGRYDRPLTAAGFRITSDDCFFAQQRPVSGPHRAL